MSINMGRLIRQRRLDAHLSQVELSQITGITQGWLSKIENGAPTTAREMFAISTALRIPLWEARRCYDDYLGKVEHKAGVIREGLTRTRNLCRNPKTKDRG